MKSNLGILYDNISGNTGDVAIGLSLRKILKDLGREYDELVPGNYNPAAFDSIIIGGGHLLRQNSDFFYDKFKVKGNNILNAMGIMGLPADLCYLDDYRYISFRSAGDKNKTPYLKKESSVVPCTTMLLEDLKEAPVKLSSPSIGIHLIPGVISEEDEPLFANWLSSLPYNIYFIPITHYNNDYAYMSRLSKKVENSVLLPIMKPIEIFTEIGKFDYIITCSLHGSIFSYIHNVPFILMDQEKSRFFLEDRGLDNFLFKSMSEIISLTGEILISKPDYSSSIKSDRKKLFNHIYTIKQCLPNGSTIISLDKFRKDSEDLFQANHQIHFLQKKINELSTENDTLLTEVNTLNVVLKENAAQLSSHYNLRNWRIIRMMAKVKNLLKKTETKK